MYHGVVGSDPAEQLLRFSGTINNSIFVNNKHKLIFQEKTINASDCKRTLMVCCYLQVNKQTSQTEPQSPVILTSFSAGPQGHSRCCPVLSSPFCICGATDQDSRTPGLRFGIKVFIRLLPVSIQQIAMALKYEYFWKRTRGKDFCSKQNWQPKQDKNRMPGPKKKICLVHVLGVALSTE